MYQKSSESHNRSIQAASTQPTQRDSNVSRYPFASEHLYTTATTLAPSAPSVPLDKVRQSHKTIVILVTSQL